MKASLAEGFSGFFKNSISSVTVKANPPHFTIVAASDNYISITHRKKEGMLQKEFFSLFPGNAVMAAQQEILLQLFLKVTTDKKQMKFPFTNIRFPCPTRIIT